MTEAIGDRAEDQARTAAEWIDEVAQVWAATEQAEEDREEGVFDERQYTLLDEEDIERIRDDACRYVREETYGVSFEAFWWAPHKPEPDRGFVSTGWGGPASRLAVEMHEHGEAWAEGQDFLTPWVRVRGCSDDTARLLREFCEDCNDV